MDKANVDPESDEVPSIGVHCSAGIGRSGTFCAVHALVTVIREHFKTHSSPPPINLVNTVLWLRRQRPGIFVEFVLLLNVRVFTNEGPIHVRLLGCARGVYSPLEGSTCPKESREGGFCLRRVILNNI